MQNIDLPKSNNICYSKMKKGELVERLILYDLFYGKKELPKDMFVLTKAEKKKLLHETKEQAGKEMFMKYKQAFWEVVKEQNFPELNYQTIDWFLQKTSEKLEEQGND